jgi:hypothetical protein
MCIVLLIPRPCVMIMRRKQQIDSRSYASIRPLSILLVYQLLLWFGVCMCMSWVARILLLLVAWLILRSTVYVCVRGLGTPPARDGHACVKTTIGRLSP